MQCWQLLLLVRVAVMTAAPMLNNTAFSPSDSDPSEIPRALYNINGTFNGAVSIVSDSLPVLESSVDSSLSSKFPEDHSEAGGDSILFQNQEAEVVPEGSGGYPEKSKGYENNLNKVNGGSEGSEDPIKTETNEVPGEEEEGSGGSGGMAMEKSGKHESENNNTDGFL